MVVFYLVFVERLALDFERVDRRKMLVKRVRHVGHQKVVKHHVLGLSRGKLRSEYWQAFEYGGVDNRVHDLRRKSV